MNKPLIFYTFLFFICTGALLFYLNRKPIKESKVSGNLPIYMLLLAGLAIRLVGAINVKGFSVDISCFIAWAGSAAGNLTGFYNSGTFCDYPPFYIYILFLIGKLGSLLGIGVNYFLVKLPSIFADLVTAYFLYRLSQKQLNQKFSLFISSLYVFNPVIFLDSSLWGQVDSFFAMLLVFALWALTERRIALSTVLFAASVLMKPQALFILPVLLFELIKRKSPKEFAKAAGIGLVTAFILIVPFSRDPLWIFHLFFGTAEGYKYASLNAFNFFAMLGANLKQDSARFLFFDYTLWGFALDAVLLVFSGLLYMKGRHKGTPLLVAALLNAGFFMVSVRMHERYMFPVIALSLMAFIYVKDKRILYVFLGFSITNFINIKEVLYRMIETNYPHISAGEPVLILTSMVNVAIFTYFVKVVIDILLKDKLVTFVQKSNPYTAFSTKSKSGSRVSKTPVKPEAMIPSEPVLFKLDKKDYLLMGVMTLIYLAIALPFLGSLKAPETSWKPSVAGESILIDTGGRTATLSRLYYFGGPGEGTYSIEFMDEAGEMKPLQELQKKDIFVWKYVDLGAIRTQRLKITVTAPGGTLNEIGLFESGSTTPLKGLKITGENIPAADQGTVENLLDEQNTIDYKHSYLSGMIFDEIYHARTAYEYLHHLEPFEWTHPPLGKIFISVGITIFGMNPFGWRIAGTLFGVAMVPLMYLFGRKLFGSRFYGFCSAFLMMFDFMHYSLSRIATIDVYGTFFVILMYYYMYDYTINRSYVLGFKKSLKPLFLCGLFFGLGAASKWIGLYAGGGLALLFFLSKYHEYMDYHRISTNKKAKKPAWFEHFIPLYIHRTFLLCIIFFIVVPAVIYCLSYIPYMSVPGPGHGFDLIFRNQRDMLNYHGSGVLGATHPFSSHWWEWPILRKPLETYAGTDLAQGMSSTMTIMGNPAIWWVGILAVIYAIYIAIRKKDDKMTVIFAALAFQYLPWVPIERLTFIYHFFSSVPFMILCIVYVMKYLIERHIVSRTASYVYLGVVLVLFIMFYPVLSGVEVPREYVANYLIWFKNNWFF